MATKAELLEKARNAGLDVNSKTSKEELESKLGADGNGNAEGRQVDEVTVANVNAEGTRGVTADPEETTELKNTDSVPKNEVDTVFVADNASTEGFSAKSDTSREGTDAVQFADESNPNRKSRRTGDGDSDFDKAGARRTGGKSYGVAADNEETPAEVFSANNAGEKPEGADGVPMYKFLNPEAGSDADTNSQEWEPEDVQALEEGLSEPENQIVARVSTSMGNYVRVKFFHNNLPMGTYKSRDFSEDKARQYLADLKESAGF